MADREKVIIGLSKCGRVHRSLEDCAECPYKLKPGHYAGMECWCRLCDDALELLTAQEPRVLSWKEVKKSGSAYRCVELYSPQVRRLALIYCIVRQSETSPEFYHLLEDSGVRWCRAKAEYNRGEWRGAFSGWRCWTSRPTEEQRKAVPWDE